MSASASLTLPDLTDGAPTGENLEQHPDFVAMERAAERKPETQYGDVITPAVPPDWKEVETLALSLLEHTRDLRVLVHLAVARLNLHGVPAFAEVLVPVLQMLETQWEGVHPRLDPEDDNDPLLRANTLARLRDERNVLRPLRETPLASSTQTGPVSWRDIAIFDGRIEAEPGHEKHNEAHIRDAFSRTDRRLLQKLTDGMDLAAQQVVAITSTFDTAAGLHLDIDNLTALLEDIRKSLLRFTPVTVAAPAEQVTDDTDPEPHPIPAEPVADPRRGVSPRSITSVVAREDALYLLELVSAYFRTNEPSSPVPLLIDRARRLAMMDFIDILRDMAPDGMGQAKVIAGHPPD